MKVIRYSLGQLQANCYFVVNDNDCLLIDPGDEASFILEKLQSLKLNLVSILATHGHFDHIGAVGEIQMSFNVPLLINRKDQFLIDRLGETAEYFLGFKTGLVKPLTVKYLTDKILKIANFELQILATPGHTPGGVCYYFPKIKTVFTGDTLFKDGIGRYDFSYCNKKHLKKSIEVLSQLPKDTAIYPGHGEITTLKQEEENLLHYINIM